MCFWNVDVVDAAAQREKDRLMQIEERHRLDSEQAAQVIAEESVVPPISEDENWKDAHAGWVEFCSWNCKARRRTDGSLEELCLVCTGQCSTFCHLCGRKCCGKTNSIGANTACMRPCLRCRWYYCPPCSHFHAGRCSHTTPSTSSDDCL